MTSYVCQGWTPMSFNKFYAEQTDINSVKIIQRCFIMLLLK
jgi:hypothetical protein